MADTHKSTKAGGLTRGKAILIAVLAVVLVVVLYLQFGQSSAPSTAPVNAGRRRPVAAASTAAKPAAEKKSTSTATTEQAVVVVDVARWKPPDPIEVVKYDPFALPDAFPRPVLAATPDAGGAGLSAAAEEERSRKLDALQQAWMQWESLKQSTVHVVMKGNDQYVAMVGDRTVQVGDEINGFTVTSIDPSGVQVERKADP